MEDLEGLYAQRGEAVPWDWKLINMMLGMTNLDLEGWQRGIRDVMLEQGYTAGEFQQEITGLFETQVNVVLQDETGTEIDKTASTITGGTAQDNTIRGAKLGGGT